MAFYILVIMPSVICHFCKQLVPKYMTVLAQVHYSSGCITVDVCRSCASPVIMPITGGRSQGKTHRIQSMPPYTSKKKTARLIYEPSLQGYSLSFSYNKDIVEFIKKAIPSHKRTTSGPPDWTWYFGSEYFDLIKLLFDGHREYVLTIVSEDEVKKKLEEAQNTQSSWAPSQYSIDAELQKFVQLLLPVSIGKNGDFNKEVKNWTKNDATKAYRRAAMFYHPDRNNGDGSKMSELNSIWAILKEGYYIK